jgi:hypothetical protein
MEILIVDFIRVQGLKCRTLQAKEMKFWEVLHVSKVETVYFG